LRGQFGRGHVGQLRDLGERDTRDGVPRTRCDSARPRDRSAPLRACAPRSRSPFRVLGSRTGAPQLRR
jgi:hypothetical protein